MWFYKKFVVVLAALFLCIGTAVAQTTISGTVFSADDNEPLMGCNVLVEGTQKRAITDLDGKFTLKNVKKGAPLRVDPDKCKSCKMCMKLGCPAISMRDGKAKIDDSLCTGCKVCASLCPFGAIME